ncbi:MAG TPA: NAD(P)-dependent oxidoreductase [Candidatus Nitrosotenuis sp.]|nr:NAD(P)-dependent oxidoreductase [Candidatus Nitrosotenuis sp.]
MKILVTGGGGFIGRHVVAEAQRRGHSLRILSRPASGSPAYQTSSGIEVFRRDLRQPEGLTDAVSGVDAVVHCSAAMEGDLAAQLAVTVEGTKNLLAAMQKADVRHIVGLSTFALYDYLELQVDAVLDEYSPLEERFETRAPYVRAKRLQEDLIREQASVRGWKWTIVRPAIVYGRGRTWFHHLGMQLSAVRWVCLAGNALLPLIYVENCAEAIVNAVELQSASGTTLNLVDDDLPTRCRYIAALAQRTQPRPNVSEIPWGLLDSAARTAWWVNKKLLFSKVPLPDLLNPHSLHARCKPLRYSNQRAKEALRWAPRWNFEQGFQRSFTKEEVS